MRNLAFALPPLFLLHLLIPSTTSAMEPRELASFTRDEFRDQKHMLNRRPVPVGGATVSFFVRETGVICDHDLESCEESSALTGYLGLLADFPHDSRRELYEPPHGRTVCHTLTLAKDLYVGKIGPARDAVWPLAVHLRVVYDPKGTSNVDCEPDGSVVFTLGWREDPFASARVVDTWHEYHDRLAPPSPSIEEKRSSVGFEGTVQLWSASYRAMAGTIPVVVLDYYGKLEFNSAMTTVVGGDDPFLFPAWLANRARACQLGKIGGCSAQKTPAIICPTSVGCTPHPWIYAATEFYFDR